MVYLRPKVPPQVEGGARRRGWGLKRKVGMEDEVGRRPRMMLARSSKE